MGRPMRLNADDVASRLAELEGWELDGSQIKKQFRFDTFADAVDFMVRVAPACDELNHHPNWCNTYNRVDVHLWTHDVDGLSALDFDLAGRMDELA